MDKLTISILDNLKLVTFGEFEIIETGFQFKTNSAVENILVNPIIVLGESNKVPFTSKLEHYKSGKTGFRGRFDTKYGELNINIAYMRPIYDMYYYSIDCKIEKPVVMIPGPRILEAV